MMYNDEMLKAAGFDGPPKTYAEWTEQAKAIKAKGLSKAPMVWPVKHTGWGGMWVVNAMAASRGGKVLDERLAVTSVGWGRSSGGPAPTGKVCPIRTVSSWIPTSRPAPS